VRTEQLASRSPCADPAKTRLTYGWPIKPFNVQHPLRGNFGDPRTLTTEDFGETGEGVPGDFSFHNGIDIAAPIGTPVYPVVSGVVRVVSPDELVVVTDDGRTFQYWHLAATVVTGLSVVADRTILGTIRSPADHVHLAEVDGFKTHNPLDPGHLEPYQDHTAPRVVRLGFRGIRDGIVSPNHVTGTVHIVASARDMPPLPVPGAWLGFPLTPVLVAWRMTTASGVRVVPETIVVDTRRTEPLDRNFWRIYAPGTYQNFPVFANHYYFGRPGRYLYKLTPQPIDTLSLPNGRYTITVNVADVCNNRGSLSEQVRIENPRLARYPPHTPL
jgi:murein DD-endopeptidase MepM/ murein hydrolase activator NlpD